MLAPTEYALLLQLVPLAGAADTLGAYEHLVGLGHERIAFLGGPRAYEHVQRRLARWREAIAAAGLKPGPVAFADDVLGAAIPRVLNTDATAVVCTSDTLALALVSAARACGIAVPDDLSVTGFDDSLIAACPPRP